MCHALPTQDRQHDVIAVKVVPDITSHPRTEGSMAGPRLAGNIDRATAQCAGSATI